MICTYHNITEMREEIWCTCTILYLLQKNIIQIHSSLPPFFKKQNKIKQKNSSSNK